MTKRVRVGVACAAVALVAGCHKAPAGQVAATVNGKEVTLQEVNTELQSANLPPSVDKALAQKVMLQRVIERKLLTEAAEKKGVDKSPEYLSTKRRADELLLAQLYAKQQAASIALPTDTELNKFMADHPAAFAGRERLSFEQIRFVPPKDPKVLQAMNADHSLDAVAARLTQLGIKYERGQGAADTVQLPQGVVTQIEKLPAGEPFVLPMNNMVTVNVLKGREKVANDPAQARQVAVAAWRQDKFNELLTGQLKSLKDTAKISYQNGFGPPPAQPGAPAAAAAPGGAK